jgi:hypothetical protein
MCLAGKVRTRHNRAMHSLRLALAIAVATLVLASCGPDNSPTAVLPIAVTGSSQQSGPLVVNPGTLTFSAVGLSTSVRLDGAGNFTSVHVSGCDGIATSNGTVDAGGSMTVASSGAGVCTMHITDAAGAGAALVITVSSLIVPVS